MGRMRKVKRGIRAEELEDLALFHKLAKRKKRKGAEKETNWMGTMELKVVQIGGRKRSSCKKT